MKDGDGLAAEKYSVPGHASLFSVMPEQTRALIRESCIQRDFRRKFTFLWTFCDKQGLISLREG